MNINLTNWQKILLTCFCFGVAIIGFMVKLPSAFRGHDKILHSAFYFLAAAFLNVLFAGVKLARHIVIFIFLALFGIFIEFAQAYSNKFFHATIHGRYDREDVAANLKGLIFFSVVWFVFAVVSLVNKKVKVKY